MNIAKIIWMDQRFVPTGEGRIWGYINASILFEIRIEGSRTFTYKLLSYPLKSDIFIGGNTSKVLYTTKTKEYTDTMTDSLKLHAEDKLDEYISRFIEPKKLFKVKLLKYHNANKYQVVNDYLAFNGMIQTYTRGDAIKKARIFKGKIEPVK